MAAPILLDTDLGSDVDDAIALALALASPEAVDLVAVTTVSGDTAARAFGAARLLGLAGRSEVEVCAGVARPLVRRDRFVWREIETEGLPPGPEAVRSLEPAPERIVRAAREVAGLELVAIGPMTNLAHALALDPELPKRVRGLTLMGGHVREARIGSRLCEPGIDYNLCSDPEASMMVLGAGFRTTLVTADVTLRTWLRADDLERLGAARGPVARALVPLVELWTPWQRRIFSERGGTLAPDNVAFLHDPLTLLACIDPEPIVFEELRILPTIADGVLRTLEVARSLGLGAPMRVATSVDPDAARERIVERLLRV